MKKYTKIIILFVSLFGIGMLFNAGSVYAATVTWDGGSVTSHDWSEADNWVGNAVPVNGDDIVLNCVGAWSCASSVDMDLTVNSIHFVGTGAERAATIDPLGGFGDLVVMGNITSDTPGSDLSANITLGADIEINNFEMTGGVIDLNGFQLMFTGTGQPRSNGIGNPTGPNNGLALLGQIVGAGDIIIDVETGTEVYMGDATPSTYTGTTHIINGIVSDGRSNIIGGQWDALGVDNYAEHMFGGSSVTVGSGGKIWFFLSEGNDAGSINNVIELVNNTPTSQQLEFINVTSNNSQVDFAVPNLVLSSDNRFDALTYNGALLIDLMGIDSNGQYCLIYGQNNEQVSNFENGPDCSDPPVDPPVEPPVEPGPDQQLPDGVPKGIQPLGANPLAAAINFGAAATSLAIIGWVIKRRLLIG